MKAIHKLSLCSLIGLSLLFISSCKKGEKGDPGKDGKVNVTSQTFSTGSWSSNSSFWYKQLSCPDLTQDNINSAAVSVYWGTTANNWTALPYTYVSSTNYFMNFVTTVGNVEIRWYYNGIGIGDTPDQEFGKTVSFKVVIIPPGAKKANPDVDMNNYQEVKEAYNIAD